MMRHGRFPRPHAATVLVGLIAGSALAAPVSAADTVVGSVGGYMNMGVGLTEGTGTGDLELGVIRDGEIHLKARGASDDGLTFQVRVELEAFTSGDQIDETYGKVSGAFGEVIIGGADTALNEYGGVGVVKPTGAFNYYDSDLDSVAGGGVGFVGEDDALGIRYGTPRISGFQIGASYQPNADADGGDDRAYGIASIGPGLGPRHQIAVGGSWRSDGLDLLSEDVSIEIGGGFLTADSRNAEDIVSAGVEIGLRGFTIAGLYNNVDEGAAGDTELFALGAAYETGPWTVGGGFYTSSGLDEATYGTFGGTYALAPGVDAIAVAEIGDAAGDGRDTEFGVAAFLNIRF